jgi:hypothetical protein
VAPFPRGTSILLVYVVGTLQEWIWSCDKELLTRTKQNCLLESQRSGVLPDFLIGGITRREKEGVLPSAAPLNLWKVIQIDHEILETSLKFTVNFDWEVRALYFEHNVVIYNCNLHFICKENIIYIHDVLSWKLLWGVKSSGESIFTMQRPPSKADFCRLSWSKLGSYHGIFPLNMISTSWKSKSIQTTDIFNTAYARRLH